MFSGGERTAEFVVVLHLQVFSTGCEFAFNLIVDHCTNVAVLFSFLVDREIHVIMPSILTLDDFDNFTQFYTKAYGLLHIAIFIACMSSS
jgi:hypothetical protein